MQSEGLRLRDLRTPPFGLPPPPPLPLNLIFLEFEDCGIIENTLLMLFEKLIKYKEKNVEILFSVVGFNNDKIIDLLNLEQQID